MPSLFLINPGAGKPKDLKALEQMILRIYQEAKRPAVVQMIDFAQLDGTLAQAEADGIRRVFAVGGDGTVNAIGSRLVGTAMHFGVIPKGSGNGYARNLGFSTRTRLAVAQTVDAKSLRVDTGRFGGIPFLNVAGVGLDAEVATTFAQSGRRGFRPYAKSTYQAIRHHQPADYELIIDGETHHFSDSIGVVVANGRQWGYDAKVSNNVSITDGYLDIMVVRKFSLLEAGFLVSRMFNGTLSGSRFVRAFRGKTLLIRRQAPGPIQIDGEPLAGDMEILVELMPQSLHLLIPNTLTAERIQSL